MRYLHTITSIAVYTFVVMSSQVTAEENVAGNSGLCQIRCDIFFDAGSITVREGYAKFIADKLASAGFDIDLRRKWLSRGWLIWRRPPPSEMAGTALV